MTLAEFTSIVLVPAIVILMAVITFFTAKAVPSLVGLVKAKLNAEIYAQLKARVLTFVSALAQDPAWQSLEGAEKKQRAILWLNDYAEKAGIPLSEGLAEKLVEEAYLSIKDKLIPAIEDGLAANLMA